MSEAIAWEPPLLNRFPGKLIQNISIHKTTYGAERTAPHMHLRLVFQQCFQGA